MKRPSVISVLSCIFFAILFSWFIDAGGISSGTVSVGILDIDSDQYLSMAGDLNGTIMPVVGKYSTFESAWDFRVPGYPLLLSYFLPLQDYGFTIAQVVVFAHFIPMLLSIGALYAVFRETNSLAVILIAYVSGSLLMRVYFFAILSEWTAYSFILVFCSALVMSRKTRRFVAYGAAAISASITTLVRPDYGFLLILLPAAMVIFGEKRLRAYGIAAAGYLPVVLLLAVNLYRFERVTFAPVEGYSLALTSLLVEENFSSKLEGRCAIAPEEVTQFHRVPYSNFLSLAVFESEKIIVNGLENVALLITRLRSRQPMSWPEINECAFALSKEIVAHYPWRYVTSVFYSFLSICWVLPIVFAVRVSVKRGQKTSGTKTFFMVAMATHLVHVLTVSAVNIMHLRYYLPTAGVMACAAVLVLLERAGGDRVNGDSSLNATPFGLS